MKRLIAAFVLILITAGLIAFSTYTVNKSTHLLLELIEQSEKDFNNKKSTDSSLDKLEEVWQDFEPTLYIFTNHETLEDISISICRVRTGDEEDFLKESAELKEKIAHLKIGETFSLHSLF